MTDYLWSDYSNGGETEKMQDASGNTVTIVTSRNIIPANSEVSASDLELDDDAYQELKDRGIVRDYPMPEGMFDDSGNLVYGGSPVEFVREQFAAAEEDAATQANAEQDILLRSYATGGLFAPPYAVEETPEAMAEALTGVEEGKTTASSKSSSKASSSST